MLRTRNQAALRFMIRVFHESRSVTQRESRRAPLCLSSIGKPWVADCDNLCHQAPVTEPESKGRPEISGLPSEFGWWSWGESNPRPSKGDRACYDHSRDCGSWLPPHRVGWARRPRHGVFPPGRRSFTPSAVCPSCLHRFCCRVAVDRPRVPLPVAMTLYRLTRSGGESEIVRIGVSVGAPFLESGQLRSHVTTTAIGVETDQPRGWWPEGHRVQISGALLSSIRTIKGTASP